MEIEEKVRILGAVANSACNQYLEAVFKDNSYDDLDTEEKLRVIKVLKKHRNLDGRYKA